MAEDLEEWTWICTVYPYHIYRCYIFLRWFFDFGKDSKSIFYRVNIFKKILIIVDCNGKVQWLNLWMLHNYYSCSYSPIKISTHQFGNQTVSTTTNLQEKFHTTWQKRHALQNRVIGSPWHGVRLQNRSSSNFLTINRVFIVSENYLNIYKFWHDSYKYPSIAINQVYR